MEEQEMTMEEEKSQKKLQPHSSGISYLWALLSLLFPSVGYMLEILWQDTHLETTKKTKIAAYIGTALQGLFTLFQLVLVIILFANANFTLGHFPIRTCFFFWSLILSLEGTSFLFFNHFYYRKHYGEEKRKFFQFGQWFGIGLTVLFAILAVYHMDAVLTTLPKGIPFDNPKIAFYALFILIGAFTAYRIAANKARAEGYKPDIFETILYIAFPLGIVGARIWWVISEWNRQLTSHDFLSIIDIRSGGLAIQGGVLLGAWVGMWFVAERRKQIPLLKATDLIVPGILIAQAIGRLGNFTNVEVYGAAANPESWSFLPRIIITQMQSKDGTFYVPLFLIEALANVLGYFVLTYGVGKGLKKWIKNGDLCFGYLVWYGTVRYVMEPLRDPEFIMGTSQQMSLVFIIVGIVLILINHLIHWWIKISVNKSEAILKWREKTSDKMDQMSKVGKILLSLPVINGFYYGFYRFIRGHRFIGITWIIIGSTIGWLIDLIYLAQNKPLLMSKFKAESIRQWQEITLVRMDQMSKTTKILLSLPIINGFYYGFYRFIKGHRFTGVTWIIVGSTIGWLIDLIYLATDKPLLMSK